MKSSIGSLFPLTSIILLFGVESAFSQNPQQRNWLLQNAVEQAVQWRARRADAESLAAKLEIPVRKTYRDGKTIELQRFENGRPVYYTSHNLNAAKTISTEKVWPGGSNGLSLTGGSDTLGIWDAGRVRLEHQEFGAARVIQGDVAATNHDHSTHVAGTMGASGIQAQAKGMAYQARLRTYEWNNDESEMSNAAAAGLRISNHSYGLIAGWYHNFFNDNRWAWFGSPSVSTTEDYKFGFYSSLAQSWDAIAANAPYYLIVKAAGNDRNDGPGGVVEHWVFTGGHWILQTTARDNDGGSDGYDSISDAAAAKNVLTVGAINDIPAGYTQPGDVVMSSFSSWGPADDGRIKPDIVANGIGLYSPIATSNTAYAGYSGTSMAAPGVAGSLGLLLQHQKDLHGNHPLRAATLKALLIHTADEAGPNPGPDYMFGWGLANTFRAAQVMTLDADAGGNLHIMELTLNQGEQLEFQLHVYGDESLRATMCWADPAGTPPPTALDPTTSMLINDLDLQINGANVTYSPWVLDQTNPAAAAATGDNIRDNVEQVHIQSPAPGLYTLQITHKGNLQGGSQAVSLIVTGNWGQTIASTVPIPNALNVNKATDIAVSFNIDVNPATLTNNTIRVDGSQSGLHTSSSISYNSTTKTANFDPDSDFKPGEVVTVTLTSGIQSSNGVSLTSPYSWSFTINVAAGAGNFAKSSETSVRAASRVTTGDLDGDGDLDLAITNPDTTTITILKNNGSGNFTKTATVGVGSQPNAVTMGDFDGDGDLDLAVPNSPYLGLGAVSILKNNGNGNFLQTQRLTVGYMPISVSARDLDGDGDLDLAAAMNGSGGGSNSGVTILVNNGNGTFVQTSTVDAMGCEFPLTAGDWDGDGDVDLAVPSHCAFGISILENDGSGAFSVSSTVNAGNYPSDVAAGDLDGDGDLDLVVPNRNDGSSSNSTVTILKNNGDGGFAFSAAPGINGANPNSVTVGDWDHDGDLDLAVNDVPNGSVSILLNDGSGSFVLDAHPAVGAQSPDAVICGDFDGDGDLDLVTTISQADEISILKNFNSNGSPNIAWAAGFDGAAKKDDSARTLAIDGQGNVCVTGYSLNAAGDRDMLTIKYDPFGVKQWSARFAGPSNKDDEAVAITVDGAGRIYVTGYRTNSAGNKDYFTIKYNSAGVAQWYAPYNGPGNQHDQATALAVDGNGNVYVTGFSVGNHGNPDYATIKYNNAGVRQWAARYNAPANNVDEARKIVVDGSGNVYVTGNSYGANGNHDYLTIKYDSGGNRQWVVRYNGPGNGDDFANTLTVDGAGNVYVTGHSFGSNGSQDYATIKFSSAGVRQWVARYNGPASSTDEARGLAVDASGNVYVSGYSSGVIWNHDYFTIKYDSAGVQQWAARYNGPGNGLDIANALAIDGAGSVYVTGHSFGSNGSQDLATIKYNSAGVRQWTARYNAPANNLDEARDIAVDTSGNVYVAGYSLAANGFADYLTIKYSALGANAQNAQIAEGDSEFLNDEEDGANENPSALDKKATAPASFVLSQNFPNPFNPTTTIRFDTPKASQVKLVVYNIYGELVKRLVDGEVAAGYHEVTFDAGNLATGIYFCRLEAGALTATQKMILAK